MKSLSPLLLACVFVACASSGSNETATQDSTAVADTVSDVQATIDDGDPEGDMGTGGEDLMEGAGDEEKSDLDLEYDRLTNEIDSLSSTLYTVTISTSAYEASADVTWYFDSDIEPRYFKQQYAVESNEGSTEYFIEDGIVVGAYVVEGTITRKWTLATHGWIDARDDGGELSDLAQNFGAEQNEELKRYMGELTAMIKDLEVVSDEGDEVTLRSETTETYGNVEAKTVTEIRLPKKVYEALK